MTAITTCICPPMYFSLIYFRLEQSYADISPTSPARKSSGMAYFGVQPASHSRFDTEQLTTFIRCLPCDPVVAYKESLPWATST